MANIRKASMDDVSQIAHVHVVSWSETYHDLMPRAYIDSYTLVRRERLWSNIMGKHLAEVLVAGMDSSVVGFLCYELIVKSSQLTDVGYELSALYVLPDYHNLGVGRALNDEFEAILKRHSSDRGQINIRLFVLDLNLRVLNFYRKLGFRKSGEQIIEEVCGASLIDLELVKSISK